MSEIFKLEFSLGYPNITPTINVYARDEKGEYHVYQRSRGKVSPQETHEWLKYLNAVDKKAYRELFNWFYKIHKFTLPEEYFEYVRHYKDLVIDINKPSN